MAQTSRHREVFGPGVGVVGIIAKPPPVRPSDYLIQETRRQLEKTQQAVKIVTDTAIEMQRVEYYVSVYRPCTFFFLNPHPTPLPVPVYKGQI